MCHGAGKMLLRLFMDTYLDSSFSNFTCTVVNLKKKYIIEWFDELVPIFGYVLTLTLKFLEMLKTLPQLIFMIDLDPDAFE